jgi:hypothetical protein
MEDPEVTNFKSVSSADDEKNIAHSQSEPTLDAHSERRLMRKIDWRLLLILGALYSISLIDRTNVRS